MQKIKRWIVELYWKVFDCRCRDCGRTKREHRAKGWCLNKLSSDGWRCDRCGIIYYRNHTRSPQSRMSFWCNTCDDMRYETSPLGPDSPTHKPSCTQCRTQKKQRALREELV